MLSVLLASTLVVMMWTISYGSYCLQLLYDYYADFVNVIAFQVSAIKYVMPVVHIPCSPEDFHVMKQFTKISLVYRHPAQ